MAKMEYRAKVLSDGHLSCPKKVVDKLKLRSGIQVKIIIDNMTEVAGAKLPDKREKIASLYGMFPQLKVITEEDMEDAKKGWDKAVERTLRES